MAEFLVALGASLPPVLWGWQLVVVAVLIVGLPLYAIMGQYKGLTRFVGSAAFYPLAVRNGLLVVVLASCGFMLRLPMPPPVAGFSYGCC